MLLSHCFRLQYQVPCLNKHTLFSKILTCWWMLLVKTKNSWSILWPGNVLACCILMKYFKWKAFYHISGIPTFHPFMSFKLRRALLSSAEVVSFAMLFVLRLISIRSWCFGVSLGLRRWDIWPRVDSLQ